MVVPHPEVAFEDALVGIEQVVIGGDTLAGVNVLERLVIGQ